MPSTFYTVDGNLSNFTRMVKCHKIYPLWMTSISTHWMESSIFAHWMEFQIWPTLSVLLGGLICWFNFACVRTGWNLIHIYPLDGISARFTHSGNFIQFYPLDEISSKFDQWMEFHPNSLDGILSENHLKEGFLLESEITLKMMYCQSIDDKGDFTFFVIVSGFQLGFTAFMILKTPSSGLAVSTVTSRMRSSILLAFNSCQRKG
jgi:hypothetical protein